MNSQTATFQRLLDRQAIYDLLASYFQGLDREDRERVRRCFSEDVRATYHERPPVIGADALVNSISIWNRKKLGELKGTTHFMGNLNFNHLTDRFAETETYAIAFLVTTAATGDLINMRSLRYLDRLRQTQDGWRISERIHTLDWSCEVPATFVGIFRNAMPPSPIYGT